MRGMIFLYILFSVVLISSALAQNSECRGGYCDINVNQNVETSEINGIRYNIALLSTNNESATLKINNEEILIKNESHSNKDYFQDESPVVIGNLKIVYVTVYFNHWYYTDGAVKLKYTSAIPYCIDSDANAAYPDGKNYFVHGYLLSAGYPNERDYWEKEEFSDLSIDLERIEEAICDPIEGPKREIYICPYGRVLGAGGVCSESPKICIEAWSCSPWSPCNNGLKNRSCVDSKKCGTENNKPVINEECSSPPVVVKDDEQDDQNTTFTTDSNVDAPVCIEGCKLGETCVPLGFRINNSYCASNKTISQQKGRGSNCENNFECSTDVCTDNQCQEKGLWQRFISWLRELFE